MSISQTIQQLKNYSGPLGLTLHAGATDEQLAEVERCYGVMLPDDFKELYRFTNGFETVEDIFNMIPLTEIISNKDEKKALWIAEYMIYADMWGLEINPDDPDDYIIVNVDYDNDRLVLTNSLAEFVQIFLKGGLYDEDGLLALHDKLKADILSATNVTEIAYSVFYYGLLFGSITTEEVRIWADKVILEQSDPDLFIIEISLCRNINDMISLIGIQQQSSAHRIVHRVLLGLAYQKLIDGKTDIEHISRLFTQSALSSFSLNFYEKKIFNKIDVFFELAYISDPNNELDDLVVPFLESYSGFNLYNYNNWITINTEVEHSLHSMYLELIEKKEIAWVKSQNSRKAKLWMLLIYSLGAISSIIVISDPTRPLSKFGADAYDICFIYFFFFTCYHAFWLVEKIVLLVKKLFFR